MGAAEIQHLVSRASTSGPNPGLQSGALPSTNYYYLRNNHAQW